MIRHTPRSMLGLAMLLVGTGAECASAAPLIDEQEQRRMKWASDRAVSRIYSIEEMRQYLRNCGDDEARAEENLPQLDAWTQEVGAGALSLLTATLRMGEKRKNNEFIYQEYKDGKLTFEGMAPPAHVRIMPMFPYPEQPRPQAKSRSNSGQRRAAAKRWWIR